MSINESVRFVVEDQSSRDRGRLSRREVEVLIWAMEGKTNWEIAVILSLSERTVKFHVHNAMAKLKATSRAHAVAVAIRRGLIPSEIDDLA
jgi:DNA-binding CsgD family transcriptional regulator